MPDSLATGDTPASKAAQPAMRIGLGYDVHVLVEGRRLVVGGVEIDYHLGLDGHSDADVLAHAIADAILGAARCGDIGQHFPPDDPEYLGADSMMLLSRVSEIVSEAGWSISDVDSVIIAQAPKMSPHRDAMRCRIAAALGIPTDSVGVKSTTTEHLGFAGRGEGIAAQAIALLERVAEDAEV